MRRCLSALAFALGFSCFSSGQAASLGASDPSILIGALVTQTGANALAGQDMLDGFNLALKQLNGRFSNQEIRLILLDDKGSPDLALTQVSKLLERERLDVVLTALSPAAMSMVVKPLMKSQLFVLSLDQPAPGMAGRDCAPWFFSLAPHPDGQHEALGSFLTQDQKRRLYVVAPDNPQVPAMLEALKRSFSGEIIVSPPPKPGAMTFQPQLDHLTAVAPDAVYSLLTGGMGVNFVRAWAGTKETRPDIPLYVRWQALEHQTLPALGDAALDVFSISPWSPDLDTPITKKFDSEFESEYGRLPTTWAAQGYDAAMLLDGALKTTFGRTNDSDTLRNAMRRAEFTSTRGFFRYNTNQFPIVNFSLRKVIRDGKGRLTFESKAVVVREWRDHYALACPTRWTEESIAAPIYPVKPKVPPPPAATLPIPPPPAAEPPPAAATPEPESD